MMGPMPSKSESVERDCCAPRRAAAAAAAEEDEEEEDEADRCLGPRARVGSVGKEGGGSKGVFLNRCPGAVWGRARRGITVPLAVRCGVRPSNSCLAGRRAYDGTLSFCVRRRRPSSSCCGVCECAVSGRMRRRVEAFRLFVRLLLVFSAMYSSR